ncbi:MAG: SCP2 sterol-binding domain-containing protein [Lachnospiraceae bacterium]|nr:SCP2 sterol-binding domain-containing protein [Lachnospiraceae bacterium]
MKVNIYYGGRGLMDDPTLFVLNKMKEVLEELRVTVECFQLYELKNSITTLPQTLKSADGVILATTVEWYGIGGYMQQFLDSCWLYGDKEKIGKIYMCPIVMSTTYGERDGKLDLITAWEILGGLPCDGICGYITDTAMLEQNEEYIRIIEKKAENLYRTINQRMACLPTSNQAVKQKVAITKNINFTPQESEQLSQYVSDDTYVQRQKADIQELASMFRDLMGSSEKDDTTEFLKDIQEHFRPQPGISGSYKVMIENKKTPLVIEVNGGDFQCYYGEGSHVDVEMQMTRDVFEDIIAGRNTFQGSFMAGDMKMKGDFKILRALDQVLIFGARPAGL